MAATCRIGFLGAGRMATALAGGWLRAGLVREADVSAADPSAGARHAFEQITGVTVGSENCQVVRDSQTLLLAVKPQSMSSVLAEIKGEVTPQHLIVSIAAGITLNTLQAALPPNTRVLRVMPNTPCLVGASASAIAAGTHATDKDVTYIEKLFGSVGIVASVPEKLLDAVTGLSGSGPAFVAVIIDALSDGGVRMGLPRDLATRFAVQTVLGSAQLLRDYEQHPGQLKDMVASPGGTTIAGLHAMETAGVRAGLIDAVVAATLRARELSETS